MHRLLVALLLCGLAPASAIALDRVVLKRDGREVTVAGQLLVTAADGGLLVLAPDSTLWTVPPTELVAHTSDDEAFQPLAADALAEKVLKEMPPGFEVHKTQHYLICHNTSKAYAQWCGGRFEQLYRGFTNYWSRQGFELEKPQFPLVALVFADRESYVKHATTEVGPAAESIIGYYNLATNRMTMYDLTGLQSLRRPDDKRGSSAQISQMLARPEAERTLATVIHEATHQIAYNSGLQTRLADIPLWVSEGIAVYFEVSELGALNPPRLAAFRDYASRRPADSLRTLVADDKRFRDTRTAPEAYAEAWALNYFLIRQRPKQYRAYMKTLSEKKQLLWDEPATRLQEFQLAFGDLDKLDADFLRYLGKVK